MCAWGDGEDESSVKVMSKPLEGDQVSTVPLNVKLDEMR